MLLRLSQVTDGWEAPYPGMESRYHRSDGGLLKHKLRDKDGVGIVLPPPREFMPAVELMPFQKLFTRIAETLC